MLKYEERDDIKFGEMIRSKIFDQFLSRRLEGKLERAGKCQKGHNLLAVDLSRVTEGEKYGEKYTKFIASVCQRMVRL